MESSEGAWLPPSTTIFSIVAHSNRLMPHEAPAPDELLNVAVRSYRHWNRNRRQRCGCRYAMQCSCVLRADSRWSAVGWDAGAGIETSKAPAAQISEAALLAADFLSRVMLPTPVLLEQFVGPRSPQELIAALALPREL